MLIHCATEHSTVTTGKPAEPLQLASTQNLYIAIKNILNACIGVQGIGFTEVPV